jgi:hypothetical protein
MQNIEVPASLAEGRPTWKATAPQLMCRWAIGCAASSESRNSRFAAAFFWRGVRPQTCYPRTIKSPLRTIIRGSHVQVCLPRHKATCKALSFLAFSRTQRRHSTRTCVWYDQNTALVIDSSSIVMIECTLPRSPQCGSLQVDRRETSSVGDGLSTKALELLERHLKGSSPYRRTREPLRLRPAYQYAKLREERQPVLATTTINSSMPAVVELSNELLSATVHSIVAEQAVATHRRRTVSAYSFALKTYKQHSHAFFEREASILESLKSSIGRFRGMWAQYSSLTADYMDGTNTAQVNRGQTAVTPPGSSAQPEGAGRKRRTPVQNATGSRSDTGSGGRARGHRRDDDDDGNDKGTGAGTKKAKLDSCERRLACPYFKHDPRRYRKRVCCGPGFATVHRVK